MTKPAVDLEKLRAYLRHMDAGDIYVFFDRALDELTPLALARVVKDYIDLDTMLSPGNSPQSLLAEMLSFHGAALRGDFYEAFDVNSRNYTEKSKGTSAFHAKFDRLLRRCLEAPRQGNERDVRQALELLFDLMRQIDKGQGDIVFYGDEGGSWQLAVQWPAVFEVWCPCLAATSDPDEYADAVEELTAGFGRHDRGKLLEIARRWAT